MINLSIVCLVLLGLPFMLGYIHLGANKKTPALIIYYRYFMTFNMILAGFFVTGRLLFDGRHAAQISGWAYSPLFHLYAIAILSMVLLGLLTVYSRKIIMLAPAICWSAFLLLSMIFHVYNIIYHVINDVNIIMVHIVYNIMVSVIMLRFIYLFTNTPQLAAGSLFSSPSGERLSEGEI